MGGWAVRKVAVLVILLSAHPPIRLTAQGVLNQFSYDNLRLSGIQLDAGLLGASDLTGSTVGGLRLDYGRIAPKVRLLLGLSYFHSRFDQRAINRFERRLDSIVNPGTPDNINLGRISLSDVVGDVDFQFVFPQGHGVTAYLGAGISVHVRNGSGAAINGTMGFEFNLSRAWRFTVDGRGVLSSGLRSVSLRTGIMYRFRGSREPGTGS